MTSASINQRTETPVAPHRTSTPQSDMVARRDRGLCGPAARDPGRSPCRRIEPQQLQLHRQDRRGRSRKRAAKNSRCSTRSTATARSPATSCRRRSRVTGIEGQPGRDLKCDGKPLSDTFSCSGEVPGFALNCVGAGQGRLRDDHRAVLDRHEALQGAARRSAADRDLRVSGKGRRHAGDLRAVRPRSPGGLPGRTRTRAMTASTRSRPPSSTRRRAARAKKGKKKGSKKKS
jgi:hypothetical protein